MGYQEFFQGELERFLNNHYRFEDMKPILINLEPGQYTEAREKTKKGIEQGVEDFLATQEDVETIYLADLSEFAFDDSTAKQIHRQLRQMPVALENIPEFADEVCKSYRMFVYNESRTMFVKTFDFPED